ncbi:MAG: sulfotransferase family 2 domain-containing protein [Planctomycetota bacterium]
MTSPLGLARNLAFFSLRHLPPPLREALLSRAVGRKPFRHHDGKKEKKSLAPCIRSRSLFIHVPKAAGISVATSLYGSMVPGHTSVRTYRKTFGSLLNRYYVFTFVRNPYERLRSAWNFLNEGGLNEQDRQWAVRYLHPFKSLDAFARDGLEAAIDGRVLHFLPQVDFVEDPGGGPGVDFCGHYETLADDYEQVRTRLGIGKPLLWRNRTDSREQGLEWSDLARWRIGEVYARDFAELGYDRDPARIGPIEPSSYHR